MVLILRGLRRWLPLAGLSAWCSPWLSYFWYWSSSASWSGIVAGNTPFTSVRPLTAAKISTKMPDSMNTLNRNYKLSFIIIALKLIIISKLGSAEAGIVRAPYPARPRCLRRAITIRILWPNTVKVKQVNLIDFLFFNFIACRCYGFAWLLSWFFKNLLYCHFCRGNEWGRVVYRSIRQEKRGRIVGIRHPCLIVVVSLICVSLYSRRVYIYITRYQSLIQCCRF